MDWTIFWYCLGGIFLFFTYVIWGVLCLVDYIFSIKDSGFITMYDIFVALPVYAVMSVIPVLNMYYVREECEWFDMSDIMDAPLFDWR